MANGYSVIPGFENLNNQYLYDMVCQDCGNVYKSNGADIHHHQCPNENCPDHKARGIKPGKL